MNITNKEMFGVEIPTAKMLDDAFTYIAEIHEKGGCTIECKELGDSLANGTVIWNFGGNFLVELCLILKKAFPNLKGVLGTDKLDELYENIAIFQRSCILLGLVVAKELQKVNKVKDKTKENENNNRRN